VIVRGGLVDYVASDNPEGVRVAILDVDNYEAGDKEGPFGATVSKESPEWMDAVFVKGPAIFEEEEDKAESIEERRTRAADFCFENADFGEVAVKDVNGWAYGSGTCAGTWTRVFYLENLDNPSGPSKRAVFEVEFEANSARPASESWQFG